MPSLNRHFVRSVRPPFAYMHFTVIIPFYPIAGRHNDLISKILMKVH